MIEAVGIVGFTGPNGVGKTLVAVSEAIEDMKRGRTVLSTVQIDCEYGSSVPITSYRQLLEAENCTVLLDEVAAIFPSSESTAMGAELAIWLQAARHVGVTIRWTAPGWMRADNKLRLCTQVLVGVQGIGKRTLPGEFWPRPLLIMAGALDTATIKPDAPPEKVLKRRIYVPQRLSGWGAYDTYASTPRIGSPPTGGACPDCGGRRKVEYCTPERHELLNV